MIDKIIELLLELNYEKSYVSYNSKGMIYTFNYQKENNKVKIYMNNKILFTDDDVYYSNFYTYTEYYNILNKKCRKHKLTKILCLIK